MQQRTLLLITLAVVQLYSAVSYMTSYNGKEYYVETSMSYNWYQALSICISLKMTLLAVDSYSKRQEISKLQLPSYAQVWIGGHDLKNSRSFEWISNSQAFSYTFWYKDEPNSKEENCVEMTYPNMGWNDVRCSRSRGFICEETPGVLEKKQEIKTLKGELATQKLLLNDSERKRKECADDKNFFEEKISKHIKVIIEKIQQQEMSLKEQLSQIKNVAVNQTDVITSQNEILKSLKKDAGMITAIAPTVTSDVKQTSESLKKTNEKLNLLAGNLSQLQEASLNQTSTKKYYYIYF
ncbi:uncharacterized protein [Musca autumnalis]|uniref:uncharacterized protein n=1 Tax=Musca autumnalis TaxID=221902 RepID=UPI003CE95091